MIASISSIASGLLIRHMPAGAFTINSTKVCTESDRWHYVFCDYYITLFVLKSLK